MLFFVIHVHSFGTICLPGNEDEVVDRESKQHKVGLGTYIVKMDRDGHWEVHGR